MLCFHYTYNSTAFGFAWGGENVGRRWLTLGPAHQSVTEPTDSSCLCTSQSDHLDVKTHLTSSSFWELRILFLFFPPILLLLFFTTKLVVYMDRQVIGFDAQWTMMVIPGQNHVHRLPTNKQKLIKSTIQHCRLYNEAARYNHKTATFMKLYSRDIAVCTSAWLSFFT